MRFRKKPVVVEAELAANLYIDLRNDAPNVLPWARTAYDEGVLVVGSKQLHIKTLEGTMTAELDDWIICGVKGELYPCKPDVFAQTYEPT